MAYGGGKFTAMNKVLPGTYINVISRERATAALSDRGVVTVPLALTWGADSEVITVTANDFFRNSMKIFGRAYTDPEMFPLREIFKNATKAYVWKLNSSSSNKATCTYCDAKCSGTRGNDICIRVEGLVASGNSYSLWKVGTYVVEPEGGEQLVDEQTVSTLGELKDNDFVEWKGSGVLTVNSAGMYLTGGTNATVSGQSYQDYLDAIEPYAFNTMVVASTDNTINALISGWIESRRDEDGVKCQCVLYNTAADYEGTINVKTVPSVGKNPYTTSARTTNNNTTTVTSTSSFRAECDFVYWVGGAEAGCSVSETIGSKKYDGELILDPLTTKADLEAAISAGHLVVHRNGDDIIVLSDINSLVTTSPVKNSDFKLNQVIRVNDQNANDVARIMATKYYDKFNNNEDTRRFIKADLTALLQQLSLLNAINKPDNNDWSNAVIVEPVESDRQAVAITETYKISCAINKSYITVYVV